MFEMGVRLIQEQWRNYVKELREGDFTDSERLIGKNALIEKTEEMREGVIEINKSCPNVPNEIKDFEVKFWDDMLTEIKAITIPNEEHMNLDEVIFLEGLDQQEAELISVIGINKAFLEQGIITSEEFDKLKADLLDALTKTEIEAEVAKAMGNYAPTEMCAIMADEFRERMWKLAKSL